MNVSVAQKTQSLDYVTFAPVERTFEARLVGNLVRARSLAREMRSAIDTNPMVKTVMEHLAKGGRSLELCPPLAMDAATGFNPAGFGSLYLTSSGFQIHARTSSGVTGLAETAIDSVFSAVTGPGAHLPFDTGRWLSVNSSRLRNYETSFDRICARIHEAFSMIGSGENVVAKPGV